MQNLLHVLNRGVDKRKIFLDSSDYLRFIHNLFELNNSDNVFNTNYHHRVNNNFVYQCKQTKKQEKRNLLVSIHAFCLMTNHYHLLISPLQDNGIPLFMKKINTAYANYFNIKRKRSGALFEGRYKRVLIKTEAHFIHLPYYIHLNPLDISFPEWREKRIGNFKKAVEFLSAYRWSSHLDYLGKKNFPSVINKEFLLEFFSNEKEYGKSFNGWLENACLETIKTVSLE